MLFTTIEFLYIYLPIVVVVYLALAKLGSRWTTAWLLVASLYFHAYIRIWFAYVLIASIIANFAIGLALSRLPASRDRARRMLVAAGVGFNLALLGYFKYANFLLQTAGQTDFVFEIVLPIGISFFTFKQIAFLVDSYRGEIVEYHPLRYALFVSFFPYLIAGPIAHHHEIMPQLARDRRASAWEDCAVGITLLAIGLIKKLVMADGFARAADVVFHGAATGTAPDLWTAWFGTLCYTFQIYFDFSGYTDMAIGIARMFGIRLPINFTSPYRAVSIIDFWRRWHITLSRFLRNYLYVPLGGNRHGRTRRYANIAIVMLLGGFWHGAGWTFILWGAAHAGALVAAHAWRDRFGPNRLPRGLSAALTFVFVAVAWVPFRAADVATAEIVLRGLIGLNGFAMPLSWAQAHDLIVRLGPATLLMLLPLAFAWVWLVPSTHDWLADERIGIPTPGYPASQASPGRWHWRASVPHAMAIALALTLATTLLDQESPFVYFQF